MFSEILPFVFLRNCKLLKNCKYFFFAISFLCFCFIYSMKDEEGGGAREMWGFPGLNDGSMWPVQVQQMWDPIINWHRAQQIHNENRRELENMILSDMLSEKKHQQEMHKMVLDTNRAIRKMHEENRMNAFKTQSQIAQQWAKALGGGGG